MLCFLISVDVLHLFSLMERSSCPAPSLPGLVNMSCSVVCRRNDMISCQSSVTCLSPLCNRYCKQVCLTDHRMSDLPIRASTSISKQFVRILSYFSNWFEIPPAWIGDHPSKDLKLCITAPLSCLPVHNIAQHIFEHVLPCRRTTLQFSREGFHHQLQWFYNVGFIKINVFHHFLPHGSHILLLSRPFLMASTDTDRNNRCFRWTNTHSLICFFQSKFQ